MQATSMSASIVIDNYNYGRFLRQCIESALAQTVAAQVIGTGYGGGEVKLGGGLPADTDGLKSNRWLLLLGTSYCQWYRIIAVGEGQVSLEGPDITDTSAVTNAVLFDEVISVSENDIKIK